MAKDKQEYMIRFSKNTNYISFAYVEDYENYEITKFGDHIETFEHTITINDNKYSAEKFTLAEAEDLALSISQKKVIFKCDPFLIDENSGSIIRKVK